MQNTPCPSCGHDTVPGAACPGCGRAVTNGDARPAWVKPPPPPEVANWVIEPVPPEIREYFLRTFDEAEFWAEVREMERTGGVSIDALIAELEQKLHDGP